MYTVSQSDAKNKWAPPSSRAHFSRAQLPRKNWPGPQVRNPRPFCSPKSQIQERYRTEPARAAALSHQIPPPSPKSRARHRSAPSQIPARPVPNLPLAISYPPLPSLPNPSLLLARLALPPSSRSPAPSIWSRSSQLRAASVAFVAVRSRPARSLLSVV